VKSSWPIKFPEESAKSGGRMLHLQGNLQNVFDALYEMGVIEPVLNMDWKPALEEMNQGSPALQRAVQVVNQFADDRSILMSELNKLDRRSLEILAMEVAREYAGFHAREMLH
jgi:hypothetical protein